MLASLDREKSIRIGRLACFTAIVVAAFQIISATALAFYASRTPLIVMDKAAK
jgi:hypothetical protein